MDTLGTWSKLHVALFRQGPYNIGAYGPHASSINSIIVHAADHDF